MRKILNLTLLALLAIFTSACSPKDNTDKPEERNGKVYILGTDRLFDGTLYEYYENKNPKLEKTYKDGLLVKSIEYYENGQKMLIETYKDGKLTGEEEWSEDGSEHRKSENQTSIEQKSDSSFKYEEKRSFEYKSQSK